MNPPTPGESIQQVLTESLGVLQPAPVQARRRVEAALRTRHHHSPAGEPHAMVARQSVNGVTLRHRRLVRHRLRYHATALVRRQLIDAAKVSVISAERRAEKCEHNLECQLLRVHP